MSFLKKSSKTLCRKEFELLTITLHLLEYKSLQGKTTTDLETFLLNTQGRNMLLPNSIALQCHLGSLRKG